MRKRGVLLSLVCILGAVFILTPCSEASFFQLNQAVARHLATALRSDLQIADRQTELSTFVNSTYVLLDALEDALKKGDADAMRCAVEQYADESLYIQDAAINIKCLLPFALSLNSSISSMLGIVSSGGTPLCIFINLSNVIVDLLSSTLGYQICIVNNDSDNSTDNTTLVEQQKVYKTYGFTTSVMNLLFCKRPLTVSDFVSLFIEFIGMTPKS
jgi:predicted nucleic acid-binding protein